MLFTGYRHRLLLISTALLLVGQVFAAGHDVYLTPQSAPNAVKILPPPPGYDSVAFLQDKAIYQSTGAVYDAKRVEQAARDGNYKAILELFSPAFGMPISEAATPAIYRLLSNMMADSHNPTLRSAKHHYMRQRPFVFYHGQTCTPQYDKEMADSGSYPSGHATLGWAVALVLAEINPARQDALLQRGYQFGQSRVICGAHWQSDVDQGRLLGSAFVASLHAQPQFERDLAAAKAEFARLQRR
ncbi:MULTISPECIES: acid phosphatase [Edwardsiella]|uniref:Acid phosphatase n=2 Tax=Edwardsiella anguillarum TaxID=1821960 RepID=A0A076LTB8_9GAMM|nr:MULTISPECIES: phosphatase PAP2 family protein [Edwardsiella]AIJ09753.1 periplasmic phosphatase, apyrase, ATP diphosphohydrolase [Edwardsiella anguillarum ET080813]AKR77462.1 phosphatase PAP2 family protein [Edwardsiella sp. LADL05-105]KAB0592691.1 phosphatase PAP2 family protein [Edwardsiella anguillarum]UOU80512.1 phosphatase PAP2 family protein [Edwardsiella anguillarum]WHP85257.1 phosphatase PAP2 family protein [Edwardsiella anguillarum]